MLIFLFVCRERLCLEEKMNEHTEEIILYNENGKISEGLSSNFFVLQRDTLYTAPDEDVLCGTTRRAILILCGRLGIPAVLNNPTIYSINSWDAAFICSTSRQI